MPYYCSNCNKVGHRYRDCRYPINSYGIIVYRVINNEIQYLLVQRRWSFAYIEFLCARYVHDEQVDNNYVKKLISLLPIVEREYLLKHSFEYLWDSLWKWSNKPDSQLASKYFQKIRPRLKYFFNKIPPIYMEPEWGFPKGKREYNESDIICAIREVYEETGLQPSMYYIHQHIIPFKEEIKAINQVTYCQKYYLARLKGDCHILLYNPNNIQQLREIRKVAWFTIKQLSSMNITKSKLQILYRVQNLIKNYERENCISD